MLPVWGWLIIIGVITIAVLILGYLWGRRSSGTAAVDQAKVRESDEQARKGREAAEKKRAADLAVVAQDLREEREKIREWYNANVEAIDEDARTRFEKLSQDQVTLDDTVDRLLGLPPTDREPTDP